MAQDWFELCENPDPVVDKSAVSPAVTTTSLGEDEEEVWRRLVSEYSHQCCLVHNHRVSDPQD